MLGILLMLACGEKETVPEPSGEPAQEPSGQHVSVRPLMRAVRPAVDVHGSAGAGGGGRGSQSYWHT